MPRPSRLLLQHCHAIVALTLSSARASDAPPLRIMLAIGPADLILHTHARATPA